MPASLATADSFPVVSAHRRTRLRVASTLKDLGRNAVIIPQGSPASLATGNRPAVTRVDFLRRWLRSGFYQSVAQTLVRSRRTRTAPGAGFPRPGHGPSAGIRASPCAPSTQQGIEVGTVRRDGDRLDTPAGERLASTGRRPWFRDRGSSTWGLLCGLTDLRARARRRRVVASVSDPEDISRDCRFKASRYSGAAEQVSGGPSLPIESGMKINRCLPARQLIYKNIKYGPARDIFREKICNFSAGVDESMI